MQRRTGGEQRRRLHLTGEHARRRPRRPFFLQICRNRLTLRTNFAVKAVLGLNHADMGAISQRLAGICQRVHDRIARRRWILQRQIFARCALLPNRRCRDHNIAAAHSRIHAAAGTHTDKCICAALDQFFQRNRRRRPADARRAHRHAFAVQMSRIHMKFPIVRDFLRIVQKLRNDRAAPRIAGQNDIPPDILGSTLQVHLFSVDEHVTSLLPFRPHGRCGEYSFPPCCAES